MHEATPPNAHLSSICKSFQELMADIDVCLASLEGVSRYPNHLQVSKAVAHVSKLFQARQLIVSKIEGLA